MRRAFSLLMLLAATALQAHEPPAFALRAKEIHTGDGRVLRDAVVLVEHDNIAALGLKGAPPGIPVREVEAVMPGLVAAALDVSPGGAVDPEAVSPDRLALDAFDPWASSDGLVRAGLTTAYLSPGSERLVPGRGALVRLAGPVEQRILVERGALHVVSGEAAKNPPALFEPPVPADVESPFEPAERQPAVTRMAEWSTLRAEISKAAAGRASDPVWTALLQRRVPLRVLADEERDIRAALDLAREFGLRLVIEGGAEAWKAAGTLAEAGAAVVLTMQGPGSAPGPPTAAGLDRRLDAPGILHGAGVEVALAPAGEAGLHHLLDLAAAAVRGGMTEGAALAAVTSVPVRLAGGSARTGLLAAGRPADLLVLSAPPLDPGARPVEVIVSGNVVWRQAEDPPRLLAVRVGELRTGAGERHAPGIVVMEGDSVLTAGPGPAPRGARVLDFPDGVAVPGFVDAFGRTGTEAVPGARPARGSAALAGADALVAGVPGLDAALRGGVTTVHLYPRTSGPVRGTTSIVRLTEEEGSPVVWAREIGVLFHVDEAPDAPGSRARALHDLEGALKRAQAYHQKRGKQEKGGDSEAKGPDEDLDLEALRPLFRGELRALVRAGRADAILHAVDLFAGMKMKPVIVGGEEADRVASDIAGRVAGVILGPDLLALRDGRWENRAALLADAGVPVLFGSFQEGGAEALGLTAAFAVRHGLGPDEALYALTGGAGEVLGFEEEARPGVLRRGAPADLVVFSGDPFLATSRIVLVVAGGDIRHRAEGGAKR